MNIKLPACYDTSHWELVPDFAQLSPRPLLVITKATESLSFVDNTFVRYFEDLKQDGIHRGAYHFFRKAADPVKQAQHFCNTIRAYVADGDLLVLDVEEGGETAAQLKTWFEYCMGQFPRNQFLLYSRKNILESIPMFLRPLAQRFMQHPLNAIQMTLPERAFFRQIPTWVAGYPNNPDLYDSVPSFYIPDQTKFGPVWLWQYTDKGNIEGASADGTDCNWMSPVLVALLGDTIPPDNGGTMTYNLTVLATYLNGRNGPNGAINFPAGSALSTGFRKDDILESSEFVLDSNGITKWYNIVQCQRAGANVAIPNPVWASDGGSFNYLRLESTDPDSTLPDLNVTIEAEGYPVTKVNIKPL